jgi:UDP-N-acetylglucosamine--N-acetylmuramyl-(pentapeptide) pyrophosphoryl-undecaprenol N-acetylglucosamine transferase
MKVIITGGGTAGHVTPLLAVASEIKAKSKKAHVRYVGQIGDSMAKIVKDSENIEKQYSILAGKWRRYHGVGFLGHISDITTLLKNIKDVFLMTIGFVQSVFILIFWRPDVVFVKGGFVGLPVGLASALLGIPIVTHDSDSMPGLTNRILSKFSKFNAVGMPVENYKKYYSLKKLRYTGVPIDKTFFNNNFSTQQPKEHLDIDPKAKVVMFMGGSLGAIRMNNAILKIINKLLYDKKVYVLWITGNRQYEEIKRELSKKDISNNVKLYAFSDDVKTLMSASDVVVSRAGATAIAELAAIKKPVILVPNPILAGGHQSKNAKSLEVNRAALIISEQQLDDNPDTLLDTIKNLLEDKTLSRQLKNNLSSNAVPGAAKNIADVLYEAIK